MFNQKPLRFRTTPNGCFVVISHKLNHDGYFRKRWPWGFEMFHRTIWRLHRGDIPEGYEIDHLCKNRACSNIEHLRCIPGTAHAVDSNRTRYASRKDEAYKYWRNTRCTGTHLGETFGVSFSTACKWIREWKSTPLHLNPKGGRLASVHPTSGL